jgi:LPXTG-motif cell wall-anchored protein
MLGAVALPQASAQDVWPGPGQETPETGNPPSFGAHNRPYYGPAGFGSDDFYPAPPTGCEDVPPPTITLQGTDLLITFPDIWLECMTSVLVGSGSSSPFDGRVPASGLLRVPLSVLDHCGGPVIITVTGTTIEGLISTASLTLSADQVAAINKALGAANPSTAGCASVPAAQIISLTDLAVTGSNTNLPVAAGIALVGVGGLVLLGARKREQQLTA